MKKSKAFKQDESIITELQEHYQAWTDDNKKRQTRVNGWNDITDAYYGKLPDNWPFMSRTVDPRLRTSIVEKNARLLNKTLRGKLGPREGGDVAGSIINNAVIDYQWDRAKFGGTMQEKLSECDIDSRLYQSKFVYVYWKTDKNKKKQILFDGNEMMPLDIRDCGLDYNAKSIDDANWFQWRRWITYEDLEKMNLKNFSELKKRIKDPKFINQDRRDTEWQSRLKNIKGLEDRMGRDKAFPVLELVIEFRKDEFYYFLPDMNLILDDMDNPYEHNMIPIRQLRYFPVQDDNLGESEVEPVLPLWRAIQATLCSFMDEVIIKMRPPLKVVEGQARAETIVWSPEAQWLVDNPNAITEMAGSGEAVRYFTNSYPALISAFNIAMGDLSQNTSNIDPLAADKTATEVKAIQRQQNARDEKNQQTLAEFIKGIVMMWLSNNRQYLFRDPAKSEHILKILGEEKYREFQQLGMDEMIMTDEATQQIADIVTQMTESGIDVTDDQIANMTDAVKIPKYPVLENPNEKHIDKVVIKPKMKLDETGQLAELSVVPQDLTGEYDYIPDVKSMEAGAGEAMSFARNQLINQVQSPTMINALQTQGWMPKFKELLVASFEEEGLKDAQRFFEKVQPGADGAAEGSGLPGRPTGVQPLPKAPTQEKITQQMAQS
jgi:hypothetical protein